MKTKNKKFFAISLTVVILVVLFFLTKLVSPDALSALGDHLPLPLTTFLIGLIDGFNPCNLFVLTMLISLMLAESHSRKKIFAVGLTFISVVYLFYFLFMAAWLNIFKYIGFVSPLRIAIALLALIAGLINIKELFFFRKGITLMIQDKYRLPLRKRIDKLVLIMRKGSLPALIGAAALLAIFASLVELPCTAGFPIIYTGILAGHGLAGSFAYYLYLAFYVFVYVLPLLVIIGVLGFTFHGKIINKDSMAIIKFIGGAIMVLLGIILLVSPGLIGLG